mgnify:CR=1 FL=1
MKGNKVLYAGIAILILGIGFAIGTYAYYQTTVTGTASGTVLAWSCKANGESSQFEISLGSLHPGSSGSKSITITSSIAADYVVKFDTLTNLGSGSSSHPYLNIYRDSAHASVINQGGEITGSIEAGGSATATFYYYWPYEPQVDTYNAAAPSIALTVVCTQK